MKKTDKLEKIIDKIEDQYLLEALEYGDPSAESGARDDQGRLSEKGKKGAGHWRGWAAVAAFAACAVLLWVTVFFLNGGGRKAIRDNEPEDHTGDKTVRTLTVDLRTLLSGNGGGLPIDVSVKNEGEETQRDASKEETSEQSTVTLTWAYQSYVPGLVVSEKTVTALNQKLREDGYPFRIQFLPIEGTEQGGISDQEYQKKLFQSGADIAFTGMQYAKDPERYALKAIRSGKYEPLNDYLQGSDIYEQVPKVLWDGTSDNGKVYFFPSEFAHDGGNSLFFLTSSFPEGEAESFDGDLLSLQRYFESGKTLLYKGSGFDFAEAFGYAYNDGVLFPEEGEAVDPLWEEHCVAFLRMLNEWYLKGQVTKNVSKEWDFAYASSVQGLGHVYEELISYQWKGYAHSRKASHVDRAYAKLLAYGAEALDEGKTRPSSAYQIIFGLDTGLA